jgi:leader peptidase (prepilin peptidase)/N-methyltransferase
MLSLLAFELPAFLLGLLFGSFLNVCIARLPYHESIVKPRSHCPRCLATIRWYDNIPLLSWLLLAARCRSCKSTIPWRYPLVELATGLWFTLAVFMALIGESVMAFAGTLPKITSSAMANANASNFLQTIALAILGFLLIGLLVMDWQTHTLPDAFTLTGVALGFIFTCIQSLFLGPHEGEVLLHGRNPLTSPGNVTDAGNVILTGTEHLILGRLLAITLAFLLLFTLRAAYKALRHRDGLGLGDAKLLAMIAAFLGFWPAILALFIGVVLASLYALYLLARRKADAATHLPLGTFLSIAGLTAALFAPPLIAWYTSLL